MSEMKHYTGELTEIPRTDSIEIMCKQICQESGMNEKEDSETWKEKFEDEFEDDYIIIDDIFYKLEMVENDPSDNFFTASKDSEGRIKFDVRFYSGGCCFSEAVEEALKKIK